MTISKSFSTPARTLTQAILKAIYYRNSAFATRDHNSSNIYCCCNLPCPAPDEVKKQPTDTISTARSPRVPAGNTHVQVHRCQPGWSQVHDLRQNCKEWHEHSATQKLSILDDLITCRLRWKGVYEYLLFTINPFYTPLAFAYFTSTFGHIFNFLGLF